MRCCTSARLCGSRRCRAPCVLVEAAVAVLGILAMMVPASVAHADVVAPTVSVTDPTAGEAVTGPMGLAADATDAAGVVGVKWYVDGIEVAADTSGPPWSGSWNSASITNGPHKVFAKGRDAVGNWGTSPAVWF